MREPNPPQDILDILYDVVLMALPLENTGIEFNQVNNDGCDYEDIYVLPRDSEWDCQHLKPLDSLDLEEMFRAPFYPQYKHNDAPYSTSRDVDAWCPRFV